MKDIDAARVLLRKANNDLTALTNMLDVEAFSEDIFGFHIQQAIEKALKAWLALLGVLYPRTHDINLLLGLIEQAGLDISEFEDFVEYNMYAVQFRYEDFDLTDQPLDRPDCIQQVSNLLQYLNDILQKSEDMI